MPRHDLVIAGGLVADGTGAPARHADIAISDGTIVAVGEVEGGARRTLDATGLLVTPGFVDIHAHYDGQALWEQQLVPSSLHGVTTVVVGNCGVGFAPVRPGDHDRLVELMEGVEDIPGTALHEGLSWEWESFPEFLDQLGARRFDIDVGTQVPHAPLRYYVMGDRGAAGVDATAEEIDTMARLACEGIAAGGLGFSTSRTRLHRTSAGKLTPTLTASRDELLGIAGAIGQLGTGVLQLVSDFSDLEGELSLMSEMAAISGRPLSFSMADPFHPSWPRQLEFLDQAAADGLEIRGQAGARAIGVLLGLQCSIHHLQGNPVYAEISGLPAADQARVMTDEGFKARLLAAPTPPALGTLANFERVFLFGDPPDYEPGPEQSVAAIAGREGCDPLDVVYDVLAGDHGRAMLYVPLINWHGGNLDAIGAMLAHPHTVPGLADGGAHVGTICDASFPTTLLAYWSWDRDHGRLPLEFVVARQARATAAAVGLDDRGLLAPGWRADVNLIDYAALREQRPEVHYDLPSGSPRLIQGADGYVMTMVAGTVTYENGQSTGALPGRLVRGAMTARGS